MLALKTAAQMYNYCIKNNLGTGLSKTWALKHFQLLIDNLKPGENVYCVFIGLHNYHSITRHEKNYAYAVTDKRIIMAQQKVLGVNVKSVSIENVNDITLSNSGIGGVGLGTVCIDTYKEKITVGINTTFAPNVFHCVHDALEEIKGSTFSHGASGGNMTGQLKELKALLDAGIITHSEFAAKKKKILGI